MSPRPIPHYEPHNGTVRVSGKSDPGKVARYIVTLVKERRAPKVDVLFIGANAGQQAYKACSIACLIAVEELKIVLGFHPLRYMVTTQTRNAVGEVLMNGEEPAMSDKDCSVWRVFDATVSWRNASA